MQIDEPLFLVLGENHTLPSHRILTQMVLDLMSGDQHSPIPIAMGFELQHNIMSSAVATNLRKPAV
jgi:hypothetical protein